MHIAIRHTQKFKNSFFFCFFLSHSYPSTIRMAKFQKEWSVEYDKGTDAKFLAFIAQLVEMEWDEKKSAPDKLFKNPLLKSLPDPADMDRSDMDACLKKAAFRACSLINGYEQSSKKRKQAPDDSSEDEGHLVALAKIIKGTDETTRKIDSKFEIPVEVVDDIRKGFVATTKCNKSLSNKKSASSAGYPPESVEDVLSWLQTIIDVLQASDFDTEVSLHTDNSNWTTKEEYITACLQYKSNFETVCWLLTGQGALYYDNTVRGRLVNKGMLWFGGWDSETTHLAGLCLQFNRAPTPKACCSKCGNPRCVYRNCSLTSVPAAAKPPPSGHGANPHSNTKTGKSTKSGGGKSLCFLFNDPAGSKCKFGKSCKKSHICSYCDSKFHGKSQCPDA